MYLNYLLWYNKVRVNGTFSLRCIQTINQTNYIYQNTILPNLCYALLRLKLSYNRQKQEKTLAEVKSTDHPRFSSYLEQAVVNTTHIKMCLNGIIWTWSCKVNLKGILMDEMSPFKSGGNSFRRFLLPLCALFSSHGKEQTIPSISRDFQSR